MQIMPTWRLYNSELLHISKENKLEKKTLLVKLTKISSHFAAMDPDCSDCRSSVDRPGSAVWKAICPVSQLQSQSHSEYICSGLIPLKKGRSTLY